MVLSTVSSLLVYEAVLKSGTQVCFYSLSAQGCYALGRAYAWNIAVHDETNFALMALLGAGCSSLLPKSLNLVAADQSAFIR